MNTLDQINELCSELRSCYFTKDERAAAEAELAALVAQPQAEDEQFERDIEVSSLTSNEVSEEDREDRLSSCSLVGAPRWISPRCRDSRKVSVAWPAAILSIVTRLNRGLRVRENKGAAFGTGALIGALGGLIGLGGAEFRLPLLIGLFQFGVLEAVILNKAMSLVVVTFSLPFRAGTISFGQIASNWPIIVNLLAGSLIGAWFGAGWATRLRSESLCKVIAVLLVAIAIVLVAGHDARAGQPFLTGAAQIIAGFAAGLVIGVVASLLGVAGGELLIPTLVLLFGADIKLAGSLSLAVSLPTMLVGFSRYSRDQSFSVLGRNKAFVMIMAVGSICGAFGGGYLLGIVPSELLLPALAAILLISAYKVWRHK
ncbi:sulfite exporter TauE/SafE family protein [Rhizobium sullae]|uniref:Probable membrane transporter protein n=1 Tax=Rhizobium sullae TaxID=50338 RepID=A0A4R3Q1E8_RHISU|nr:sulfite exporter TauE/SafE family protein [Rhizobium sullae]TCU14870.1 putative membrane protein YfcA [Rhizobium sullae]